MASIYKRGNVWWTKYFRPGSRKPIRASLDTSDEIQARKRLKILEGELAKGNFVDVRVERIRFGHLLDLVLQDYVNNARRSYAHAKCRIEGKDGTTGHLRPALGDRRAITINAADISDYISKRKADKASNATINRELNFIKRAFALGWQAYRLPGPHIDTLEEDNVREGFFDRTQLEAVRRHLPEYLKPVALFGFLTGWRVSELRQLQWKDIDFEAGEIRLQVGSTKNRDGRIIKMTAELRTLLEATKAEQDRIRHIGQVGRVVAALGTPFVFVRHLKNRKVLPLGDFGKSWDKACIAASLPGRIFHDLRRSAVRQFVRRGIPERVAMQMTGHRTRDVFERYNIVSSGDLEEAARKIDAGTNAGTAGTDSTSNIKKLKDDSG